MFGAGPFPRLLKWILAFSSLTSALVIVRAGSFGFANWDDSRFIVSNPIRAESVASCVRWAGSVRFEAFHPIHQLFLCAQFAVLPHDSIYYHGASTVLLLILGYLVYGFLRAKRVAGDAAWCLTLLACMHPLMTEARVSLASQKDLLGLIFGVAGLWSALAEGKRGRLLALLLFGAAAFSKAGYSSFALAQVFIWSVRGGTPRLFILAATVVGVGPLLGAFVVTRRAGIGGSLDLANLSLVPATVAHYSVRYVWPANLTPVSCFNTGLVVILLGTVLLVGACWLFWHVRGSLAADGIALAGLGLLPFLNLAPTPLLVSDRYATMLCLGLALAAGSLWERADAARLLVSHLGSGFGLQSGKVEKCAGAVGRDQPKCLPSTAIHQSRGGAVRGQRPPGCRAVIGSSRAHGSGPSIHLRVPGLRRAPRW